MINRRINSSDLDEDLAYIKTTYNLSPSTKDVNDYNSIKSIKNITLVPRSGTHNNFKVKEEVIIYIISGSLLYSDNLGNTKELTRGNIVYINSGEGITYEIFNNGCDLVDIVEINTELFPSAENYSIKTENYDIPTVLYSITDNIPENQWKYRVSSKYGLAPIKSFCDINIYSLCLNANEITDFKVNKNRVAYLLQGYGGSIFKGHNTNEELTLVGSDGLKINDEVFELKSEINSDFLFIETSF